MLSPSVSPDEIGVLWEKVKEARAFNGHALGEYRSVVNLSVKHKGLFLLRHQEKTIPNPGTTSGTRNVDHIER